MSATTAEWLLEISGLTVGPAGTADPMARGRALAVQVQSAAADYLLVTHCVDDGAGRCTGDCLLADIDGGHAACGLARRLAPMSLRGVHDVASPATPAMPSVDAYRVAPRYIQALRAAATGVFHCRHSHAVGECWFSAGGDPLCGEVLAVAHRLGG